MQCNFIMFIFCVYLDSKNFFNKFYTEKIINYVYLGNFHGP